MSSELALWSRKRGQSLQPAPSRLPSLLRKFKVWRLVGIFGRLFFNPSHETGKEKEESRAGSEWIMSWREASHGSQTHRSVFSKCSPAWFSWHELDTSSPECLQSFISRGNSCCHWCPNSCQFTAILGVFCAIWPVLWGRNLATKNPCNSLSYKGLKLVAGVGFEPTTFRL